ncbi:FeoB small GTPase domain-containing protein [Pseudonocardia sp.]|uniref:FeoA family protein n=1 Tax=Pseudonocardia sp. TaxID=60912 RepID=UPI003D12692D
MTPREQANESGTLDALVPGDRAAVTAIAGPDDVRRRLMQMGFVPGTVVDVVATAPLGDPLEVALRGYRVAVRRTEAAWVSVGAAPQQEEDVAPVRHPVTLDGPGAAGPRPRPHRLRDRLRRRHRRAAAPSCHDHGDHPLQRQAGEVVVALAGNPNTGKSSLFNALTGSRQHVGNWPGKTVTRSVGIHRVGDVTLRLVDLPGMYSLHPASPEEAAAEEFLVSGEPDVVVAVVDGTNLERNLFLVLELAELGLPLIVAANMADVAARQGRPVDRATLAADLGAPVVATVGRTGAGITELADAIVAVATPHASREDASAGEATS